MIQQSSIPTSIRLQSTGPQDRIAKSSVEVKATPSSSSPPAPASPSSSSSSDGPAAGARKTAFGKPSEQQLNSSGSDEILPRARGISRKPGRADQNAEEAERQDQQAMGNDGLQIIQGAEEDTKSSSVDQFHSPDGASHSFAQTDNLPAADSRPTNPSIPSQTDPVNAAQPPQIPGRTHQHPDQVLSPSGYILGFLQPAQPGKVAFLPAARHRQNPSSSSSADASSLESPSLTQHSEASSLAAESSSESQASAESDLHLPRGDEDKDEEVATAGAAEEEDESASAACARSAAVRLLLGFMGALQASQYAVENFVSNVVQYYR